MALWIKSVTFYTGKLNFIEAKLSKQDPASIKEYVDAGEDVWMRACCSTERKFSEDVALSDWISGYITSVQHKDGFWELKTSSNVYCIEE